MYGTLKRGQINHQLIEPFAVSIRAAEIDGALYDLGDFPALAQGNGSVSGELVRFAPRSWERVLAILDRLENCDPFDPGASMYSRRVVDVRLTQGGASRGWTYIYNPDHPALNSLGTLPLIPSGEWLGPGTGAASGTELQAYRRYVRTFTDHMPHGD